MAPLSRATRGIPPPDEAGAQKKKKKKKKIACDYDDDAQMKIGKRRGAVVTAPDGSHVSRTRGNRGRDFAQLRSLALHKSSRRNPDELSGL